jgi:long-subunit acyl-CoA synthetase (AMP-forming)
VQAGVYTTNTPEALGYVVGHSDAAVLVVDDAAQLDKALSIRDRFPK